jgi:enamine deaminase RidA (YjgF/YER057c/UK114 family)
MKDASIEDQTRIVLENLKAVLEADGLIMDHVVSTSVFMKDLTLPTTSHSGGVRQPIARL